MNELGKTIQQRRKEVGISQEALGIDVEDNRQNILNTEAGRRIPSDDVLKRIAQRLDMPYEKLIALKVLEKTPPEIYPWLLAELKARLDSSDSN